MKLKNVRIKNFRGIGELETTIDLSDFNIFIGDNGTCKTTILEAINLCLSPGYTASRFDINDFNIGTTEDIEISIEFDQSFNAILPDGFAKQSVPCNKISLIAKKRKIATPGKAFSDLVTTTHFAVPMAKRGENGWTQKRKTSERDFEFTERHLSITNIDVELPRIFYFPKNRTRQLTKGFNSSFTNIINDLNWRFEKTQRDKPDEEHFKHHRKSLHEIIISETGGDTIKKTVDATNKILDKLGINPISISVLKTLSPYDNSEIVFSFDGFELPIEHGGSGIEMIIALSLLESMAKISKEQIILLIDEPELHLHPKLQWKLFDHLKSTTPEIQIVASTHSPILFKNMYLENSTKLLMTKMTDERLSVTDAKSIGFGLLKWSPSWGEICYFAYDLPTIEFHADLYSALQDRENKGNVADIEKWFITEKGFTPDIKWKNSSGLEKSETLMTYIRNRMHHGDNQNRPMYTLDQLRTSIEQMIDLLKIP